jgi:glycerophosphoryl diester phosphodiesterase
MNDRTTTIRYVEIQGHRGARGLFPENTLPSFARAMAIGVSTLEMDVGLTKDGVLVVHHDLRLSPNTTRDARGQWLSQDAPTLRSLNFSQLARYDVGRIRPGTAYARRFPDQEGMDGLRIPKLRDVIEAAEAQSHQTIGYNIETKLNPLAPEDAATPKEMVDALLTVLRETGIGARTTIQSFDFRSLARVQEEAPEIQTACLTDEETLMRGHRGASPFTNGLDIDALKTVPKLVEAAGCRLWSPNHENLQAEAVAQAHDLGLRVVPWTVNSEARMRELIDSGVDGLISDYPDRARRVLEELSLPLPPRHREQDTR